MTERDGNRVSDIYDPDIAVGFSTCKRARNERKGIIAGDARRRNEEDGANRREQAYREREWDLQRGGETIGILHARPIEGRRDEDRVATMTRGGERGGCTVACTCALPPYTTRSYGVFLHVRSPYNMCATNVRIRSYLNRRNQLHFWNGWRPFVHLSVHPSVSFIRLQVSLSAISDRPER